MQFSFPEIQDALTGAYPEREALVFRDRSFTWSEWTARTNQFANLLASHRVGLRADPDSVDGSESPHDHVALYLHNGNEYLEAMVGAWRARAAATNVNYRYVEDELAYVLKDQSASVIVYHGRFSKTLAGVLDRIERPRLLIRVDDGSGDPLLDGAVDYETALAAAEGASPPRSDWSPSDRYILYTGGTTGYPKGVLWRQHDFLVRALGLTRRDGSSYQSVEEIVERGRDHGSLRTLPLPPFMHGAAHWNALSTWLSAGTVVVQDIVDHFDATDALLTAARRSVSSTVIVGDAFARPLIDALDAGAPVPATLRQVISSGAILSRPLADALRERLPGVRIIDVLGSSESGRQGIRRSKPGQPTSTPFDRDSGSAVLSEDRTKVLEPGDEEIGWLASSGQVPCGYLGDPVKSAATFPVIGGVRYSVPGDRARLLPDDTIELHGRESATINSGGEKIFVEEVEQAIKEHPDVDDVLVVGRPSERWGQEVVAVAALKPGRTATAQDLLETASRHVARFKLPKEIVFVDEVPRSPSGKPDYGAARSYV